MLFNILVYILPAWIVWLFIYRSWHRERKPFRSYEAMRRNPRWP